MQEPDNPEMVSGRIPWNLSLDVLIVPLNLNLLSIWGFSVFSTQLYFPHWYLVKPGTSALVLLELDSLDSSC
jgi:hypothetical protein